MNKVSSILSLLLLVVYTHSSQADAVNPQVVTTFNGASNDDRFGVSVAVLGDVNGDGFKDVLIGASADDTTAENAGAAYLYLGTNSGFPSSVNASLASAKLTGPGVVNTNFGINVAGIGDINGDGISDFAVGANQASSDSLKFNGNVFIFFGRKSGFNGTIQASSADLIVKGNEMFQYVGTSISSAGDFNKDGLGDFLIGNTIFNGPGAPSGQGAAYLFLGKASFPASISVAGANTKLHNPGSNNFGISVSGIGDINADGYSDIAIGAPNQNYTIGRAYVILGRSEAMGAVALAQTVAAYVFDGESTGSYFGSNVSGGGDINNDGYADFTIGATGYSSAGARSRGSSYVFYGGAGSSPLGIGTTLATVPHVKFEGDNAFDNFSQSATFLGDINNDGIGDTAYTAHGSDQVELNGGKLYLVAGALLPIPSISSITPATAYSFAGTVKQGSLGNSTSGPIDSNKNSSVEVLVGAPGQGSPGSAYLIEFTKLLAVSVVTPTPTPTATPTPEATPIVVTVVTPSAPRYVNMSSNLIIRNVKSKLQRFTLFTVRYLESATGADHYEFEVRAVNNGSTKSRYLVGSKNINLKSGQWLRSIIPSQKLKISQTKGKRLISAYFYKIAPSSVFQVRMRACNGTLCSAFTRVKNIR